MNTRNTPTVVHIDTRRARPPRLAEAVERPRHCNFNCVQGHACDCEPAVPDDTAAHAHAQQRSWRWCGALAVFWLVAVFAVVALFGQPVLPR